MSEQNKTVVRRLIEESWNQNNLAVADELLLSNFVDHNLPPGAPNGVEGYKQGVNMFRAAFPDIRFAIDHMLAERDRVAIRLSAQGTHQGNFMGIAPTGRRVTFRGMAFIRLDGSKVAERWGLSDLPGLMQQLTAPESN